jgi:hypothetical protein
MSEHLDEASMSEFAMSALGIVEETGQSRLGYRLFAHLADCAECRRAVSELSAILAGETDGSLELSRSSLEGYRSVPFAPSLPVVPPMEHDLDLSMAAETESILERLPAFAATRKLRSEDGMVELTVTENLRDDRCRVYVTAKGDCHRGALAFYMPPGVVCPWPEQSYFEYPSFTFRTVDWSKVRLLYALGQGESAGPPADD